jgi:lipopolysaccharide export system permease protein
MIIERYILRSYLGPFLFSMSVITFVFIMDFILKYIDLFLGKGVQFSIVLQTFMLSLGHMFALIIPMAVLPATLMTFGNLASENEITAMKASGVSLYRMILPGVVGALVLTLFLIFYNNYVMPESNHKLLNLLIDIQRKKPTVELKENQFIDDLKGYTIYFQGKDDRTGEISDVQIFRHQEKGELPTTIVAATGKLKFLESENVLRVDLHDGEIHELPVSKDRGTYRRTKFKDYTLHIRDIDRSLRRSRRTYRGDREMSVSMMESKINEIRADIGITRVRAVEIANQRMETTMRLLDPEHRRRMFGPADSSAAGVAGGRAPASMRVAGGTAQRVPMAGRNEYVTRTEIETQINKRESFIRQINRYRVEIQKKFSIPFACVIFVLVGSPLAIRMGRSGMNMAIGLSILFFLVYYVCLIGGEKLADRGIVSPIVSMWAPNIFFLALAIVLLRKAAREQSMRDWTIRSIIKQTFRRHAANTR